MSLSPIHETPDKMIGGEKKLIREMSDSSQSYSPVPGQGAEDGGEEFFGGRDLLCTPSGKFQAPRSREIQLQIGNSHLQPIKLFAGQTPDKYNESEGKLNTSPADAYGGTTTPTKLSKRESLKAQKKNYRREKKRVTKELLSALKDPSIVVMADHLKVRGTLKSWTKLWCVLKPGLLIIYKSPKHGQWVGTVLLNNCELIERPSRKDGFCFKIYHPLEQSIWGTRGPKGETMGSITQPLPSNYLIFRAPSEAAGKCWMDALELALRCSGLLMRSMREGGTIDPSVINQTLTKEKRPEGVSDTEIENTHFKDEGLDESEPEKDREHKSEKSDSESDASEQEEPGSNEEPRHLVDKETTYVINALEELGIGTSQTETLADENKGLIWGLMKQVRPGMDLSKVVLPTFILEPRSFLDKLSDFYYHSDMISEAVMEEDAFSRMKQVVRWYLSGFYKKPKGLKKPYNPIIGETFRCLWAHHKTDSRTFYISEQVSHHPPVSAFYVTNRKDGFVISGSILAKSKFYGNSVSAMMDGVGRLCLLSRGEDYHITMPYANCKGILYGTLTMEYGGKVSIECEKTGYRTEIEFKLKPFLGGSDSSNLIVGKIKFGKETLATLDGKWDEEVLIKDKRTGHTEIFWAVTQEVRQRRLPRSTVAFEEQGDFESEKLWCHVTNALKKQDVTDATHEKYLLEEEQRKGHKERKMKMQEWMPRLFERDEILGDWVYKHMDTRPWDPLNDIEQFENDGVIQTRTRHKTQILRTTSIVSLPHNSKAGSTDGRVSRNLSFKSQKRCSLAPASGDSECSTPEVEGSDNDDIRGSQNSRRSHSSIKEVMVPLLQSQKRLEDELKAINNRLAVMGRDQRVNADNALGSREWVFLAIILLLGQLLVGFIFR